MKFSQLFVVLALTACFFIGAQSQGCRVCIHKTSTSPFDAETGLCLPVRGTLQTQAPWTAQNGNTLTGFTYMYLSNCPASCVVRSYSTVDHAGNEHVMFGPEIEGVIPFCARSYIATCF